MPLGEEGSTPNESKGKYAENERTINGLSLLAKLGIDLGVSSVDHQTPDNQESLLDNVVFEADDYTFKDPQKSLFLSIGEKKCHLEITNILPPVHMPLGPSLFDDTMDEDAYRRKYAHVDRQITHTESLARESPEYVQMRREVMEDTEILYPSDHLSIQYTRKVYLNVSNRESHVVSGLYSRIESSPCLKSAAAKFEKMTNDLAVNRELLWNSTKQTLMKEMRVNGQLGEPDDKLVEEVIRNDEYLHRKKRLSQYFSVQYFSSSNKFCDGCPIELGSKNFKPVLKYPKHYLIRKWEGNDEVDTIYTNENGRKIWREMI